MLHVWAFSTSVQWLTANSSTCTTNLNKQGDSSSLVTRSSVQALRLHVVHATQCCEQRWLISDQTPTWQIWTHPQCICCLASQYLSDRRCHVVWTFIMIYYGLIQMKNMQVSSLYQTAVACRLPSFNSEQLVVSEQSCTKNSIIGQSPHQPNLMHQEP